MPKIISDIEDKIYRAAFALFTEKGYDAVNMKMVAEKAGIAVGTLYNYHKNKKKLYLNVLNKSWQKTFCRLNQILKHEEDDEKLSKLISTLYTHISQRKGIGRELLISGELQELGFQLISKIRSKIIEMIDQVLTDYSLFKKCKITDEAHERLIHLIFIETIDIGREFDGEEDKNVEFIMEIIDAVLINTS